MENATQEPMTEAQANYLKWLCDQTREEFDPHLNKHEAAIRIDELQRQTDKLFEEEAS